MKTENRKAKWVSRKGHSALLAIGNSLHETDSITNPHIYQKSNLEIGYQTFCSGISELRLLGLITSVNKTIYYDNGLATRTFKASLINIDEVNYINLLDLVTKIYTFNYSVETVAALTTVTFIDGLLETVANNGWFNLQTYKKHLNEPHQVSRYLRAPTDAVGYVEVDLKRQLYRLKQDKVEEFEMFRKLDTLLHHHQRHV